MLKKTLALAALLGALATPAVAAHAAGPRTPMCGTYFVRQTPLENSWNTDGLMKVWKNTCRNTVWLEIWGTGDNSCAELKNLSTQADFAGCAYGDHNIQEQPIVCGTTYSATGDANGAAGYVYTAYDSFSLC